MLLLYGVLVAVRLRQARLALKPPRRRCSFWQSPCGRRVVCGQRGAIVSTLVHSILPLSAPPPPPQSLPGWTLIRWRKQPGTVRVAPAAFRYLEVGTLQELPSAYAADSTPACIGRDVIHYWTPPPLPLLSCPERIDAFVDRHKRRAVSAHFGSPSLLDATHLVHLLVSLDPPEDQAPKATMDSRKY